MKKFNLLSRAEMKKVMGGMDAMLEEVGAGGCRVAIRNSDGSWRGWSYANYSVGAAQGAYSSNESFTDGSYVSGYCCASCPF